MKKLVYILPLLFLSFISFSQVFVPRGSSAITNVDSRLKAGLNFYLPWATDTTLNGGLDSLGALLLVIKTGDTSLYMRIPRAGGNKWVKMLRNGDPAGGVLSFNTRTGNVTLNSSDITTALGYIPPNPNGTNLQYIAGDGSKVTFPTIPAQFNPLQGYGITITGTYPNKTFTADTSTLFPALRATLSGSGILSLNGLAGSTQTFATASSGTDFSISSSGSTHTFSLPSVGPSARGLVTSSLYNTWNNKLGSALSPTHIFVGNGSNAATDVAMSGDATINSSGAVSLASIITAGSCTSCNISYDAKGRITVASNGGGGGGGDSAVLAGYGITKNVVGTTITLTADSATLANYFLRRKDSTLYATVTALAGKQPTGNYITALTGDVGATGPGSATATIQPSAVTTTKINNNAVTYGKIQAMTANRLLGSGASGTAVAEITLGTGLSFTGTTLNASGSGSGFSKTGLGLGNTSDSVYRKDEQYLGLIYSKNSWTAGDISTTFTNVGGITVNLVGGKIQLTGTSSPFQKTLDYNYASNLDRVKLAVLVKVISAPTGTNFGLAIGQNSLNTNLPISSWGSVDLSGPGTGHLSYTSGATYLNLTNSATSMPLGLNDQLLYIWEHNKDSLKFTAINLTRGDTAVYTSLRVDLNYGSPAYLPNTGNFSFSPLGGVVEIDSIAISSTEVKNGTNLFLGDSKWQGYYAGSAARRAISQVNNYTPSVVNSSGGGDRSTEWVLKIPEMLSFYTRQLTIEAPSNDPRTGIPPATTWANIKIIADSFAAHSIPVVYCTPIYETSQSMTGLLDSVNSKFPASQIIDLYTGTKAGWARFNSGDNIHLNGAGNDTVALLLLASNKLVGGNNNYTPPVDFIPTLEQTIIQGNSITADRSIQIGAHTLTINGTGLLQIPSLTPLADAAQDIGYPGGARMRYYYGQSVNSNVTVFGNIGGWGAGAGNWPITVYPNDNLLANRAMGIINTGTFQPVAGFMNNGELQAVLDSTTSGQNTVWIDNNGFFHKTGPSGGTATFEQTLLAGNSITANRSIQIGANTLTINGTGLLQTPTLTPLADVTQDVGYYGGANYRRMYAGSFNGAKSLFGDAASWGGSNGTYPVTVFPNSLDGSTSIGLLSTDFSTVLFGVTNTGKVTLRADSVGTQTGGCLFLDYTTKRVKLGPCGGSSGSDTLKAINAGSGLSGMYILGTDTVAIKSLKADNGLTLTTDADSTNHIVLGGPLAQTTTFTQGSRQMIFKGTTTLLNLQDNSSVVNYGMTPNGTAPFYFNLGWTTLGGSYTRGHALAIDTFNNVYTTSETVSYPGYSNGNSLLVGGNLVTSGAQLNRYLIITTSQSLGLTNNIIYVDATGGNVTVTLPSVASASTLGSGTGFGILYTIKRIDASGNTVTVSRAGSDLIDGATSFTLASFATKTIQAANSTNWYIQ